MAGDVKERLVSFAGTPPFQRHLRRIAREVTEYQPDLDDAHVVILEALLFGFRYDDGSTIVHRFVQRPELDEAERAMALGFLDGVDSVFEVLDETPAGATDFAVRCCVSDLVHVIAPTLPLAMPAMPEGSFLIGRMNPIAGTDLWTPSGSQSLRVAESRDAVADAVMELALHSPWLTHRNPEKRRQAAQRVAANHERFVSRHGSAMVTVAGAELPDLYAEAMSPDESADPEAVATSRAGMRQSVEDSDLVDADEVTVISHPVAGFGFYVGYADAVRALESGAAANADDLAVLHGFLDDPGVPVWLLRPLIVDRLPTAEAALATALGRPGFRWDRDGDTLLASCPGDTEPVLTLAIVPSMCS